MTRPDPNLWRFHRLQPWVMGGFGLLLLLALVQWGGTARPGPLFVLGVTLLAGLMLGFAALIWWLYLSPLEARVTPAPASRTHTVVAGLAALSGLLFISGGLWDEVWHRRFGGFGQDFLWPPHLLIYVSLALMAAFAFGGLYFALRGRGGLRERFRREPLIGLLGLVSLYLLASLPSDELWHRIYGPDITAWSLPHIFVVSGVSLVMLCAVSLALSGTPRTLWRGLGGLEPKELLTLLLLTWATSGLVQILTAEWESIRVIPDYQLNPYQAAFWARPEWLYPVLIISVACFAGNLAQYALRRVGAATALGVTVLGMRWGMLELFGGQQVFMGFTPHALILIPLLALDLWRWYSLRRPQLAWAGNLWAAIALLAFGLPVIAQVLVYPRINETTLPGMIVWGLLLALFMGGVGRTVGTWLRERGQSESISVSPARLENNSA